MRWYAACHVVASDQREANADAPPFEEIAKRLTFSESGLVTFLLDPHAKMPNMNLTHIEAGDIAAYVSKLR
jgi:mono/diheme cytochrome c family protein